MRYGIGRSPDAIIHIMMERLADGVQEMGYSLTERQINQYERYFQELVDWNKTTNLTTIISYEDVQVKHFLDSLSVITAMDVKPRHSSLHVIDIGAGAGFPGLPVKIMMPEIRLTLLEATNKKAGFLSHVVAALGLENVHILAGRAEEYGHDPRYREQFDIVLSRAVAALPTLAEYLLPYCAVSGRCIAQKKGNIDDEVEQAREATEELGGKMATILPVSVPGTEDQRCLVIMEKVRPTPGNYPRRTGVPSKRPLG